MAHMSPPPANPSTSPVPGTNAATEPETAETHGAVEDGFILIGKGGKPISTRNSPKKTRDESIAQAKLPQTPAKCDTVKPLSVRPRVEAPGTDPSAIPIPPPPPPRLAPRTPQGPAVIARPRPPDKRFLSPAGTPISHRPDKRALSGTPSPNSMEGPERRQRLQFDPGAGRRRRDSIGASSHASGASHYFNV